MKIRRAKRASGGIIIYIKDDIRQGVRLVNNEIDCVVWLKLDKTYFSIEEDIYICIPYVAPGNSPIHGLYNVDIFNSIEDDVFFKQYGKVFLFGDLNSRISIKPDYIENDRVIRSRDFETEADTPTPRCSMDRGTNHFGESLLDLSKATGMRIVNGRFFKDQSVGA